MTSIIKRTLLSTLAIASAFATGSASATIVFEFTNTQAAVYNGNILANTTGKFATASFTNVAGMSNAVDMTLSVLPALNDSFYVDQWVFNIAPSRNQQQPVSITSFTYQSGINGNLMATPTLSSTSDGINFTSVNGGRFDFGFSFVGFSPKQLSENNTATFRLTGTNLTENSLLTANAADIFASVRVATNGQNVTYLKALNTDGKATVAAAEVPEPASLALLGMGLLGAGMARRKKRA